MRRLALAAAAIALSIAPLSSAAPEAGPAYAGQFVADPEATVEFEIVRRDRGPDRVRFQADGFQIRCEDEPGPRRFTPIFVSGRPQVTAEFVSRRAFEGRVIPAPIQGYRQFYKFQGRLSSGNRAQGFVFYWSDLGDEQEPRDAECSTEGLLRWTADRAG